MIRTLILTSLVVFVFIFHSCQKPASLSEQDLKAFVMNDKNGLVKMAEVKDYRIAVIFRPADLLVAQELNADRDSLHVSALRKKYSNHYYFVMSLSKNNREALQLEDDFGRFSDLVQNLSFRMSEFVTLTTPQDTIPVSEFVLDRTYGMGNATNLLFVFNKEKTREKDWVQFNLSEFGLGTGYCRFRFAVESLETVPRIRF